MRLLSVSLVVLVVLAGCTGTLVDVHSGPATIPESAFSPVGYIHGNTTEVPLTYPLGVGPVSRDITVYVWVSGYSRTVASDEGTGNQTAGILVVSSPNRRLEGQSVNPFAQLSNRGVVARLFDVVDDVDNATGASGVIGANVTEVAQLEEIGVQNRTVLGVETEVVTYRATVRIEAAAGTPSSASSSPSADSASSDPSSTAVAPTGERTLMLHLMAVEHGEDVVFALGVHGDDMDEAATIAQLMEAIEHEVVDDAE